MKKQAFFREKTNNSQKETAKRNCQKKLPKEQHDKKDKKDWKRCKNIKILRGLKAEKTVLKSSKNVL